LRKQIPARSEERETIAIFFDSRTLNWEGNFSRCLYLTAMSLMIAHAELFRSDIALWLRRRGA